MTSNLERYRQAKADVVGLEAQARKELLDRLYAVMEEEAAVRKELRDVFGMKTIPKAPRRRKVRRVVKGTFTAAESQSLKTASGKLASEHKAKWEAKRVRLERQIAAVREKLGSAGKPEDKRLADRLYELEDELRLLREAA